MEATLIQTTTNLFIKKKKTSHRPVRPVTQSDREGQVTNLCELSTGQEASSLGRQCSGPQWESLVDRVEGSEKMSQVLEAGKKMFQEGKD